MKQRPTQNAQRKTRPHFEWQLRTRTLDLGPRTLLMGIINVTPDSFSDGGQFLSPDRAVDHALRLLDQGADLLDIGGESTRPGSPAATPEAIRADEEQSRVLPVIEAILQARPAAVLSVDTYRASTAQAAIQAGAQIVNDVSGLLWDPAMAATCAQLACGVVLMHTRGLPSQWAALPPLSKEDILPTITRDLQQRLAAAENAGIPRNRIVLDPGFGFGKRGPENWTLLTRLADLQSLNYPLLIGLSRKGFLAPDQPAAERDTATHAANTAAILSGAHILRVHDIPGAKLASGLADHILKTSKGIHA